MTGRDHVEQPAQSSTSVGVREVVGILPSTDALAAAVEALGSAGFDRARLSALAGDEAAASKLASSGFQRVQDLLDRADVPRTEPAEPADLGAAQGALVSGLLYVGAALGAGVAIASGALAALPVIAATAGSGGVGGAVGAFLAHRIGSARAREAERHLAHGGLVLWVRVTDADEEARATSILERHGGTDVHAHGPTDAPHR